jgi:hypothetical protein
MDDIFMVGNPEDVAKAFKDWCQITIDAGGLPNLDKCKIYSTSDAAGQNEALQTMTTTPECQGANLVPPQGGMRCLGYPLGSQEYCRNFYNERAEETVKYVDKIIELTEYGHEIAIQSSYQIHHACTKKSDGRLDSKFKSTFFRTCTAMCTTVCIFG